MDPCLFVCRVVVCMHRAPARARLGCAQPNGELAVGCSHLSNAHVHVQGLLVFKAAEVNMRKHITHHGRIAGFCRLCESEMEDFLASAKV